VHRRTTSVAESRGLDGVRYGVRLMRRPQSASRLLAVLAGLLVLLAIAAPVVARSHGKATRGPRIALHTADATRLAQQAPQARRAKVSGADECTGWKSTKTPPATIRVLRAKKRQGVPRRVVGTVEEVPFREYVGVVLAAEWPDHYPLEALKAGALAVKQYAWYYSIVYRGGEVRLEDGEMACYDVQDTTVDQVYYPEHWAPSAKHLRAIGSSWPLTVRKFRAAAGSSTFFLTGYRSGASVPCGRDADGWKLYQQSVRRCGLDGLRMRDILRTYLEPRLEIVTLGRHDIIGNEKGDAAAFVRNDQDELVAHVWTPGAEPPEPGSRTAQAIAVGGLVGALSSDVDGDGRDDLVWMRQTAPTEGRIKVALSNGADYGESEDWYAGTTKGSLDGAFLLSGDLNGDERRDMAILTHDGGGHAAAYLFKQRAAGGFRTPARWWSGPLDLDHVSGAWAGDVSGDGRADLIIREDPATGGVRIRIALAARAGRGLGQLKTRFSEPSLRPTRVRVVPGDADRDGREDVFLVVRNGGPGRVDRLKGRPAGALVRSRLWKAPKSDPIDIRRTRLGVADVDYDGLSDLLLFTKDGDGTRIRVLRSRYTSMEKAPVITAPSASWQGLLPY
jgi:hypothetical protein